MQSYYFPFLLLFHYKDYRTTKAMLQYFRYLRFDLVVFLFQ